MARRQWFDLPDKTTPLSASFLNDLEARKPEVDHLAVNVKDYGAIGDGLADDTAAIAAAMVAGYGKSVYFPAGVYIYDTGIDAAYPNTRIYGAGKGASELKYTGSGVALTWGQGISTPNMQFVLQDIRIRGTSSATCGLYLDTFQDFTLINCDVIGFATGYGIWVDNTNSGISINTDVRQNLVGWRVGNFSNHNTYIGGQCTDNGYAVHVYSECNNNTWYHTNFDSQYDFFAVYLQAGQFNSIDHCWFESNRSGASTAAVFIGDQNDVTSSHFNRIVNNWFVEVDVIYMVRVYRGQENLIAGNVHSGTGSTALVRTDAPNAINTQVYDNVKGTSMLVQDTGVGTRGRGVGFSFDAVASAGTIAIPPGADVVSITGTTTITTITASYVGRHVTLVLSGVCQITDGSNLKLNGNFTGPGAITLACDGTNWWENRGT